MTFNPNLLLVGAAAQQLKERLEASGYNTISWELVQAKDKLLGGESFAGILLSDEAIQLCDHLRQHYGLNNGPALLLRANQNDLAARRLCLDHGADDFWLADAPPSDLLRRLRRLIPEQLPTKLNPNLLRLADLSLDQRERRAWRGNRDLGLTAREYGLLLLLIEQQGVCVSRKEILEQVWGLTETSEANIIEVYVSYLRRKLEANGEKRLIHTVRGQGYCLRSNGA
jgi:DNA-binding response OmpR family regulator